MKLLLLIILILLPFLAFAENSLIPQEIEWDGDTYVYDPYWKERESCKYGDFDGDGEDEVVVSFMGAINIAVHRVVGPCSRTVSQSNLETVVNPIGELSPLRVFFEQDKVVRIDVVIREKI